MTGSTIHIIVQFAERSVESPTPGKVAPATSASAPAGAAPKGTSGTRKRSTKPQIVGAIYIVSLPRKKRAKKPHLTQV